jgi:stress response protein SCP2
MFIFLADQRKQNLGQLRKAFARVRMEGSTAPPIQVDITQADPSDTGLILVRVYRNKGHWKLDAAKHDYKDLKGYIDHYRLSV